MATQVNGLTPARVDDERQRIEFWFGDISIVFAWTATVGKFFIKDPVWLDGRRTTRPPNLKAMGFPWKDAYRQAYGIAEGHGWKPRSQPHRHVR